MNRIELLEQAIQEWQGIANHGAEWIATDPINARGLAVWLDSTLSAASDREWVEQGRKGKVDES